MVVACSVTPKMVLTTGTLCKTKPMLPMIPSTHCHGNEQAYQVKDDDDPDQADAGEVPRLVLHERHGTDEAVRMADDERESKDRYQDGYQLHQAGENLALKMALDALPPSRFLSSLPTERLVVFGTQSRLPYARRVNTLRPTASAQGVCCKRDGNSMSLDGTNARVWFSVASHAGRFPKCNATPPKPKRR